MTNSFFFQLCAGGLWLLLLVFAGSNHIVPPEFISVSRGVYFALLSIFLIATLKSGLSEVNPPHIRRSLVRLDPLLALSLVPSLVYLSMQPYFSTRVAIIYLSICLLLFLFLSFRNALGANLKSFYDFFPPLLILICLMESINVAIFFVAVAVIFFGIREGRVALSKNPDARQQLLAQMPLYISPVFLVYMRDFLEGSMSAMGSEVDRVTLEALGMIINGCGAAVATAMVMSKISYAPMFSGFFAFFAVALTVFIQFVSGGLNATIVTTVTLIAIESIRVSVWLLQSAIVSREALSTSTALLVNFVGSMGVLLLLVLFSINYVGIYSYLAPSISFLIIYLVLLAYFFHIKRRGL